MCGVVGILGHFGTDLGPSAERMVAAIRYRGPDDCGAWIEAGAGLALGHARLAVLDLSPEGHQPMASSTGRYVVTYNGEVYNFLQLRKELEDQGMAFRGRSDTEVILAAIERWGVEGAIQRFVGMFAFGLWDRTERRLYLVRDRIGIKPLYYGWAGKTLLFASELKAFRAYGGFRPEVYRDAVSLYLRYGYIPAPHSIYRHVHKLPPGCILSINLDQVAQPSRFSPEADDPSAQVAPVRYWSAKEIAERGGSSGFGGSEQEALELLETKLREAVQLRMISDVPLGAFLSGGIDSSVVVALMQAQSSRRVQTFSIGFHEQAYNEAQHAKNVAHHLGTEHTELYVTAKQAMEVIPRLPTMYDEPFADASQIPTFLVSELARRSVTVALSGDGGDELFGGYTRYFIGQALWNKVGWVPRPIRTRMGKGIKRVSVPSWNALFRMVDPARRFVQRPGDRIHKLADLLGMEHPDVLYEGLVSQWKSPLTVVRDAQEPLSTVRDPARWARLREFPLRMMYLDLVTYLPDDILTKVDRASMAVSLEARVPLLDHRLMEFVWQLPLNMKIQRALEGKWLLRRVLDRYVPKTLIERPKMGFGVPMDSWLRGPLRDWAESLLDVRRLREEGMFEPDPIRERWREHLTTQRSWEFPLWTVLMFQAWYQEAQLPCQAAVNL